MTMEGDKRLERKKASEFEQLLLENRELKSLLAHIVNGGYVPDKCAACTRARDLVGIN